METVRPDIEYGAAIALAFVGDFSQAPDVAALTSTAGNRAGVAVNRPCTPR
jgi:hypothetical protein